MLHQNNIGTSVLAHSTWSDYKYVLEINENGNINNKKKFNILFSYALTVVSK